MAAMLAPAGCSLGDEEDPQRASGTAVAVAFTVERLERAIASQDFATVCDDIFTERARRRSGGGECAAQLRSSVEGVRRPSLQVRRIKVEGDRATVEVTTRAAGDPAVDEELELRREEGRWKVEALS